MPTQQHQIDPPHITPARLAMMEDAEINAKLRSAKVIDGLLRDISDDQGDLVERDLDLGEHDSNRNG